MSSRVNIQQQLLKYNNTWNNVVWAGNGATVTLNAAVAPDGTSTAQQVSASSQYIEQTLSTASLILARKTYTFSLWMRSVSGTATVPMFIFSYINSATLVQTSQTVTTTWQKFTVTATIPATEYALQFGLATGTYNIYVWGASAVVGNQPGTLVNTTSSVVNYGVRNNVSGRASLPLGSNFLYASNLLSGANWGTGGGINLTQNAGTDPFGGNAAVKMDLGGTLGNPACATTNVRNAVFPLRDNEAYCLSVYAKVGTIQYAELAWQDSGGAARVTRTFFDVNAGTQLKMK